MPKVFEAPPGFVLNPDYLVPELRAQRDALLEALKYLDKVLREHGRQHWPEAVRVHAVIKMAEETK
jgi:hypothetical protein